MYKKPKYNNTVFILKKSYYIVSQMQRIVHYELKMGR